MFYRENGQYKTSYAADAAIFPIRQDKIAIGLLLLFAFAGVPLLAIMGVGPFGHDYIFKALLIPFLILALAAIGLNILVGYCGQISLGAGAFMAVGAYSAYNFALRIPEMPLVISILLGGGVAALVGILFGIPSLRIKGLYLAVATLAAQFFFDWLFLRVKWFTNYTPSGSVNAPNLEFFGKVLDFPDGALLADAVVRNGAGAAGEEFDAQHGWPSMDGDSRHGHRRRDHRHPPAVREADGVRDLVIHHWCRRRALGLRPSGLVGAAGVQYRSVVPAPFHGNYRRSWIDHGIVSGRCFHSDFADHA